MNMRKTLEEIAETLELDTIADGDKTLIIASKVREALSEPSEEEIEGAASHLYELYYRDTVVTEHKRPTAEEMELAWQRLGKALGRIGEASKERG